jgi:thiol-disulfide isomerase/thioredoxin
MMRALAVVIAMLCAVPAQASELRAFGRDGWRQLTAAHAGRPLVVHFWSLSCAPCMAELPRWGRLAAQPHAYDLVLVDTDSIMDAPRVLAILERAGLGGAENWAFADSFAAKLRYGIDPAWQGELPMTRLVAPDGGGETVLGTLDPGALAQWQLRTVR